MGKVEYNGFEKYMFSDAYLIFLKYKDIKNVSEYWKVLDIDLNTYRFKYKNHPLTDEMIQMIYHMLQHKNLDIKLGGFTHDEWDKRLQVAKDSPLWNPDGKKYT